MKSLLLSLNRVALLCCVSFFIINSANASPWFEPDDVYLRSDLQVLADAGLINSPINTYPLKWARINADLQKVDVSQLPLSLRQSYAHVVYALQGAALDRNNQRFKAGYANKARNDSSFSAPMTQKWQSLSSYEITANDYAYRLAVNYQNQPNRRGNNSSEFSLDNSFFAYNFGNASVSVGSLQRWWGPTWIYNLAWGHTRGTIPGVDFAYDGYDWPLIGNWHIETFIGNTKTLNDNHKQWSSRFEFSPINWLDLGVSYQKWFSDHGFNGYLTGVSGSNDLQQDQYSGDIRVSLPTINFSQTAVTQSLYAQGASLINDQSLGSMVVGWQSQFNIGQQYFRWIVESKTLTSDGEAQWRAAMANRTIITGLHNQLAINNSDTGNSKAVKLIWITSNDWQWALQGQRSQTLNTQDQDSATGSITIPLANSNRLTLGSDYIAASSADAAQWSYWASWEFRF